MVSLGVLKESEPGERRVAAVPAIVPRLTGLGLDVLVEHDAGVGAFQPDSAYAEAGATSVDARTLDAQATIVWCVGPPPVERLRSGQVLLGLLNAPTNPDLVAALAARGVTALSLELLPRTLSRAQAMDALTSQANIAGYKAAIVAADTYGGYFPLLMTAAGTAKPAQVLVLGAGVAGLAAIGTAKRLGAVVTGYDVRPETREEVQSLGARFLDLGVTVSDGVGGYARALTDEEREAQQEALQERIGDFDVVITTALVPGRRPPLLVTEEALKGMRPGSVVVDIAAGPKGCNVEGAPADGTVVVDDGVTVVGAGRLASAMAPAASMAYARNLYALTAHLVRDGAPVIDLDDEILGAITVTHEGSVR
jgi:proton-translocating NAD(P)+ transhydrogenase subunit alpha